MVCVVPKLPCVTVLVIFKSEKDTSNPISSWIVVVQLTISELPESIEAVIYPFKTEFNASLNSSAALVEFKLLLNDVALPPVNVTLLNKGCPFTVVVYKSGATIVYVSFNTPDLVIEALPKTIFPASSPVTDPLFTVAVHNWLGFESNGIAPVNVIFLVSVSYVAE